MPGTPYSTGADTGSGMIEALLARLMGPEMAQMLSGVIANAIGKAGVNMPGGGQLSLGNNALFGPMNAGAGIMNSFQRSMLDRMTSDARASDAKAQMGFREHFYSTVLGMSEASAKHSASTNFAMNMGIDMLFATDRRESRAGLVIAGQHMGAAALGSSFGDFGMRGTARDEQRDINDKVKKAIDTISTDFEKNRGAYGGATAGQFGGIVRDMARLGEIDRTMSTTDMQTAVRTGVRATMGFGQALGMNPLQARDFMNVTTSMHMVGALGGARAETLAFRMQSAQRTSGVGPNIFQNLAAPLVSMQMALGMQVPAHENIAIMMETAGILAPGSRMVGGTSGFFTNEASMREGVLRNVFSASQSDRARMITGAMAIMKGGGAGDAALRAFREKVGGGDLSAANIAAAAGLQGTSAESLLAAGNTKDAMRFAAEGAGMQEASAENLTKGVASATREAAEMIGKGGMTNRKGKNVSTAAISAALKANGFDVEKTFNELDIDDPVMMGHMRTIGGDTASRLSFKSVDEFIDAAGRNTPEARARRKAQEQANVNIMESTKHIGKLSGIEGLRSLFKHAKKTEGVTAQGLVDIFTGGDEATQIVMTGMFGSGGLRKGLEASMDSEDAGVRRAAKLFSDMALGSLSIESLGKVGTTRRDLAEKLASGEIKQDEFQKKMKELGNLELNQDIHRGSVVERIAGGAVTDVTLTTFGKGDKFDKEGATGFAKKMKEVRETMAKREISQEKAFEVVYEDEGDRAKAMGRLRREEENGGIGGSGLGGGDVMVQLLGDIKGILGKILEGK